LYQLQTLFSYLSMSEKQAVDTNRFCHSYKDERGEPINVRIQQDAQEFFNVLCDRLEKQLKGGAYADLIKRLFGGQLVNQLLCHGGCNRIRESEETFYCTSLQVKSKATMTESLY